MNIKQEPKPVYRKVSHKEAQEIMATQAQSITIDVRSQEEYNQGHIPGAQLLPLDEIAKKAESVLGDKGQTILVYCRSGARSEAAAKQLVGMGYSKVYDFGGVADWPGGLHTHG